MRVFIYLMFTVNILLLSSCKNEFKERKITQIDSLQKIIYGLQNKLQNTDTAEYKMIYSKLNSSIKIFKEYAVDIPNDQDFRNRFALFTQLEKSYKTLFKEYNNVLNEINYTVSQLDNLKSDINSNAIKEQDKISNYFNQESESVRNALNKTEKIFTNVESYKVTYKNLRLEMESFADKLKTSNSKK